MVTCLVQKLTLMVVLKCNGGEHIMSKIKSHALTKKQVGKRVDYHPKPLKHSQKLVWWCIEVCQLSPWKVGLLGAYLSNNLDHLIVFPYLSYIATMEWRSGDHDHLLLKLISIATTIWSFNGWCSLQLPHYPNHLRFSKGSTILVPSQVSWPLAAHIPHVGNNSSCAHLITFSHLPPHLTSPF